MEVPAVRFSLLLNVRLPCKNQISKLLMIVRSLLHDVYKCLHVPCLFPTRRYDWRLCAWSLQAVAELVTAAVMKQGEKTPTHMSKVQC
eukprot:1077819-Amphidinium_carterae.1